MTKTPQTNKAVPAPRRVKDPTSHRPGQTTPQSGGQGRAVPRLPHERDESADSQTSAARPVIEQARRDVEDKLVDTDRGPVLDELYERRMRRPGKPRR